MVFVHVYALIVVGNGADAMIAAIKAHAGDIALVDHDGAIDIGVMDDPHINVAHGRVVAEHATIPAATDVADAVISEAVADAAIKADVRSPVAGVPEVRASFKAPVAGRPEHADRRQNPCSRHPIVAVGTVCPVAGRPDVARSRAKRLDVNDGKGWRSDVDREANGDLRGL